MVALDPVLTTAPVYSLPGQYVRLTATVANTGGMAGSFLLEGDLELPGGTVEGHLWASPPPSLGAQQITGQVPPGGSVSQTMYSNTLAYADQIAGYNPGQGLTVRLVLTDMQTGAQTVYTIPNAVFLPARPTPGSAPVFLATQVGATSVTVVWSSVTGADYYELMHVDAAGNPAPAQYAITVNGVPGNDFQVQGTSATITGLAPNSPLHLMVRACNTAGCGPWSPVLGLTTG